MKIINFIILVFNLSKIYCDTIEYISPNSSQVFPTSNINVTYFVMRNGMLYLTESTIELINSNDDVILKFTNEIIDTYVSLVLNIPDNYQSGFNYSLRVTSSGFYNSIINGSLVKLPLNTRDEIPFSVSQMNLSNKTEVVSSSYTHFPKLIKSWLIYALLI